MYPSPFEIFSTRLFDETDPRCYRRRPAGMDACIRCEYSSSSSPTSSSTQTVTSSGAGGVSAGSGSASAGQGSLVVGQGAKYQETGSVDLSGSKDSTLNIATADPQIVQSALQTVQNFSNQLTTATQNNTAALAALATTTQTGNQSQQNNVVLYVTLAAIAGVVLLVFAIFKK